MNSTTPATEAIVSPDFTTLPPAAAQTSSPLFWIAILGIVALIAAVLFLPTITHRLRNTRTGRLAAYIRAKLPWADRDDEHDEDDLAEPADDPLADIPGRDNDDPRHQAIIRRHDAHREAAWKTTAREYSHSRSGLVWHITRFLMQADSEEVIRQLCEDEVFLAVGSKDATRIHFRVFTDDQLRLIPQNLRESIASARTSRHVTESVVYGGSNGNGTAVISRPPPRASRPPNRKKDKTADESADDDGDLLERD